MTRLRGSMWSCAFWPVLTLIVAVLLRLHVGRTVHCVAPCSQASPVALASALLHFHFANMHATARVQDDADLHADPGQAGLWRSFAPGDA